MDEFMMFHQARRAELVQLHNESRQFLTVVHCKGICTSLKDDMSGMYLEGEECPACYHVWNEAHVMNGGETCQT